MNWMFLSDEGANVPTGYATTIANVPFTIFLPTVNTESPARTEISTGSKSDKSNSCVLHCGHNTPLPSLLAIGMLIM